MAAADVKHTDAVKHAMDPFDTGEVLREMNMRAAEMSGWGRCSVCHMGHMVRDSPEGNDSRSKILHLLC